MSGDVQPRKRKDKRRKRDDRKSDGDVTVLRQSSFQDDDESSHGVHITKMGNDDVHLHVHHEHDTGGNWCAKIIFFSLMAVLLGLVGLIILENRGLEDMDTPLSESRFSNYFNGLVDEHRGEHDVHDVHKPSGEALDEHDDHDDQDEEEEPLSEEIEEDDDHDHDDHEEEEEPISEEIEEEDTEQEQEEDEEEVEQEEQEQEQEEDDDEEDNNAGENITAEDPEDDAEDEDNVEEATVEATTEATAEATTEYDVEEPEEDEPEDDAEDEVAESQEPASSTAKLDEEDEEDNDEADEEEIEEPVQSKAQRVPATTKYVKVDKYDEDKYDDDDFESLDEEPEDLVRRVRRPDLDESEEQKQDDDEEEPKEGSSWLASQIKPKDPTTDAPASVPVPAADDSFQQELRQANAEMIRENYAQALRSFNTLIQYYADEPLAHLARAHFLERLAERERSNQRLLEAIDSYKRYLAFGELVASDGEFLSAGERCIEHLRFMGYHHQTVAIHELLIERLPADPRLRNQLSFTHLTANNMRQVKFVAAETLKLWPADPVAQLHFGLALKQLHGDYVQALSYLQNAIESKADGTQEAYFYLALGETLQRLSRQPEAVEVHRQGVARGFFVSVYQRSLYNEPKLRAQPFWQPSETGYNSQLRKLQHNWISIREEALALLSHRGYFEDETENLRHMGIWQQFELFAKGQLIRKNCQRAPITCSLLKEFPESSGCRRGQVKFSVMQAETHVWPHCGPTNCRLRAHLTLVAPEPERTSLRVAEQERTWREGELIIFDDSFEHEVWHNGTRPRLVLILDMWHPDLTVSQRRSLTAI
ncbi:aspartyl/asparaginyl beta-hydroxylase isoform X5 [Drosophila persimilis]|uniref:aspartyl/asparaginyl beta-hydroxylase isoform X5 n=1 Tax=Drosophila persimilis TaxID=7234 RepID=UPI000F090899|nr:aspartyl/asparaginyl beta-hydroxylase isoform X5 [Drosophila persimilis]